MRETTLQLDPEEIQAVGEDIALVLENDHEFYDAIVPTVMLAHRQFAAPTSEGLGSVKTAPFIAAIRLFIYHYNIKHRYFSVDTPANPVWMWADSACELTAPILEVTAQCLIQGLQDEIRKPTWRLESVPQYDLIVRASPGERTRFGVIYASEALRGIRSFYMRGLKLRAPASANVRTLAERNLRVPAQAYEEHLRQTLWGKATSERIVAYYESASHHMENEVIRPRDVSVLARLVRDAYEIELTGSLLHGCPEHTSADSTVEEASHDENKNEDKEKSIMAITSSKFNRAKVLATGRKLLQTHKAALVKAESEAEAAVTKYAGEVAAKLARGQCPTARRPQLNTITDRTKALEDAIKLLDHVEGTTIESCAETTLLMTDAEDLNKPGKREVVIAIQD